MKILKIFWLLSLLFLAGCNSVYFDVGDRLSSVFVTCGDVDYAFVGVRILSLDKEHIHFRFPDETGREFLFLSPEGLVVKVEEHIYNNSIGEYEYQHIIGR